MDPYKQWKKTAGFRPPGYFQPDFIPFNAANLPTLSTAGTLQSQPAQVGNLASEMPQTPTMPSWVPWAGAGAVGAGQLFNLFQGPPQINWSPPALTSLSNLRKNLGQTNRAALTQNLDEIRRNAARTGIGNSPGFLASMQQPAWQTFGRNQVAGEAAISAQELQAQLAIARMELQKALAEAGMQGQWPTFGDILSDVGEGLPWFFGGRG